MSDIKLLNYYPNYLKIFSGFKTKYKLQGYNVNYICNGEIKDHYVLTGNELNKNEVLKKIKEFEEWLNE